MILVSGGGVFTPLQRCNRCILTVPVDCAKFVPEFSLQCPIIVDCMMTTALAGSNALSLVLSHIYIYIYQHTPSLSLCFSLRLPIFISHPCVCVYIYIYIHFSLSPLLVLTPPSLSVRLYKLLEDTSMTSIYMCRCLSLNIYTDTKENLWKTFFNWCISNPEI